MINLLVNLASVNRRTKSSAVRELLALISQPDIISFAGGLPDPDGFPLEEMEEVALEVIKNQGRQAFQYAPTEGVPELKEQLIEQLKKRENIYVSPENLLIVTGAQQGIDLLTKAMIDPTDSIIVELPSYIGALQVFRSYGANLFGVRSDDNGPVPEELEKLLKVMRKQEEHYKFLYTIPDFQNPSGITTSQERREELIRIAEQYKIYLVEDSPYRQIRFEGDAPDMIYKLDTNQNTITFGSFSKTLTPGFRLGYVIAHPEIIKKLAKLKQSVDLCTSTFAQYLTTEFLKRDLFDKHVDRVIGIYKKKRDVMLKALDDYMPKEEGISWTRPEGGLFLWLRAPDRVNTDDMFQECVAQKVAYIIGSAFHCDHGGTNAMRLNFSYASEDKIEEGIKRLANVIKNNL